MKGSLFRVLFEGLKHLDAVLVVPQVVLDELENKYREELQESQSLLHKELSRIMKMTGKQFTNPLDDHHVEQLVQEYRHIVKATLLFHGAIVADYPEVPHSEVVEYELMRRKPFSSSGAGYRDFLIWRTVVGIAKDGPVAFISQNEKDFALDQKLHPQLVEDLVTRGLESGVVRYFHKLEAFVGASITPILESICEVRSSLLTGTYAGLDLKQQLLDCLALEMSRYEADNSAWEDRLVNPPMTFTGNISDYEVDVRRLPSGELLITASLMAECVLQDIIPAAEYFALDQALRPRIVDQKKYDQYVVVESGIGPVSVWAALTYDPTKRTITSQDHEVTGPF